MGRGGHVWWQRTSAVKLPGTIWALRSCEQGTNAKRLSDLCSHMKVRIVLGNGQLPLAVSFGVAVASYQLERGLAAKYCGTEAQPTRRVGRGRI